MRRAVSLSALLLAAVIIVVSRQPAQTPLPPDSKAKHPPPAVARPPTELVVRVLDVGQGDATLIENGGSRVLIDGGPDEKRFGHLLDSLNLNGQTFDVVILTHQHADHLVGLRALFEKKRHITVRYF